MTRKLLTLLTYMCAVAVQAQHSERHDTIENVVVTGTRTATTARSIPFTVSVIDQEKLTENERINVLPTLEEQVPGLFVTQRGMLGYGVSTGAAGGMSLRGISSATGQLLVLIDGHPQYNGIYGHSIADSYQTMMAEKVEVLRGPASVLYGSNAMGGIINIITRQAKHDTSQSFHSLSAGSWGTIQNHGGFQYRKGPFSTTFARTYVRTDNHRRNMGFDQGNYFLKAGYDFSDHWSAFADIDITHFNSCYPGATNSPVYEAEQWITRGIATMGADHHYGRMSGRLSAYHSFGWHKINDGYAEGKKPQDRFFRSKDALTGISWYEGFDLFEGNHLTVGIDYQHIYGNAWYTDRETGATIATPNKQSGRVHNNETAGYIDVRQDITSWLTADAGIRYDYHSVTGQEWIPQFGIVARPMQSAELRLTASKGFRNPTMKDMYLYPPSNTDLQPERLWNYEVAWSQRLGDFRYGVNLFLIDGDNMIQQVQLPKKKANMNTGLILNRGAEVEAAWRVNSHWTINTNHSYLYMRHHLLAAPQYKGYLGAGMRYGKWTASAGLQQIAGLYTAVGTDNDPMENFTLLNATVKWQATKSIALWTSGENLLAQRYEINAGYPMPRATFMAGINLNLK